MQNSLFQEDQLPKFKQIKVELISTTIQTILAQNKKAVEQLLQQEKFTWDNLMVPLQQAHLLLNNACSAVTHLHNVCSTPELREAYKEILPQLTDYYTELQQNQKLYRAVKQLVEGAEFKTLSSAQQRCLTDNLRDFQLSGVSLGEEEKKIFAQLSKQLVKAKNEFEENVLDCTDQWFKHINDETLLEGLPLYALELAQEAAKKRQLPGAVLTLDYPCYSAVITYCNNNSLREELYRAYNTRASDQGPHDHKYDNGQLMQTILQLRHQLAHLLGFKTYPENSLATKMVETPQQVFDFLEDLAVRCKQQAKQEFAMLEEFAGRSLKPWDVAYYSEKLKQHRYGIDQQMLREYFPIDRVLAGMFQVTTQLFAVTVEEQQIEEKWHPQVRFFTIFNEAQKPIAHFYLDLYARAQKRGGAWMDDCRDRHRNADGTLQLPVAFLTCNFTPPGEKQPSLLMFDEVITLFHEFGHGLHHMLTEVEINELAGINGVPWDGVELPSQFMENWCWQESVLELISSHYQSGDPLPVELYQKLVASKHFQSAMFLCRQVELALFDFRLHQDYSPDHPPKITELHRQLRGQFAVYPLPEWVRLANSFTHIFGGGYAAGYYSYLWAEVLSSDAFSKFEQNGLLNREIGMQFHTHILSKGSSQDLMAGFIAFREREPTIDAMLRHLGIGDV